ncbi:tripartite ATP-independent periplasmic transporter solute receptor, DctP family [Chelatococcus sambhunathii]|uniref:TRAP dicarboxylate transporter subunit DctP n=2 Tax=Chelatococcus TaxID=28209 RepID=A0AAC9JPP4_9HYPH|nr:MULTISPECIES: sialic acid TRAP transporter substrate-binding protein SiaP [Chelatococcus]APF36030.1 TRAP dicarboxylate transporter subunit DctP [Chelatococcus daeguensis]CUA88652.1 tripartite ATP-independent periplasmic transporter solute receptor, DctP family [Chelatococcus sambhunathii]
MHGVSRRTFLAGSAALGAGVFMPAIAKAQATVIRWGEMLPQSHPQVQMIDRIAAEVKEKSGGRIDIQSFPNGQLGSGKDMMDAVVSGALAFTTDGAAALGALLPQLSVIEAPYLWRDAAHMTKAGSSPIFAKMNEELVRRRGLRMLAITYYGKRHLTTGNKEVRSAADMAGFKLRVPPVDTFRAMAEAWGARATPINFNELYLALSQGAVDGQENPLPTIHSAKLAEVQKYLVLTGHIITPRLVIANEAALKGLSAEDRAILDAAIANGAQWQDAELSRQEGELIGTLKTAGMTIIEPDVESFRKPVLEQLPPKFEEKWGKGTWDALAAL